MKTTSNNANYTQNNNYEPDYYDTDYEDYYDDNNTKTYRKKHRKEKRKRIVLWLITLGIIAILVDIIILMYTGKIWFNSPTRKEYPVFGVTVSSLQGEINFTAFEMENISFAYIKATEGENLIDKQFKTSWDNAKDSTVKTGAYHKFSFSSDGKAQAENFINTVGKISSDGYRLFPAVEITKEGVSLAFSPEKQTIVEELKKYCKAIKDEYGFNPIIITGNSFYEDYLKDDFAGFKLWIIDLFSEPKSIDWDFWNYSPRGKIGGVSNKNNYVNLSVFKGSKQDFMNFQYK